jgi:WD40 repeat protein/serine/threonine protein kinase
MNPERWRQVEAVLQAALDRGEKERAAYLDEVCAADPGLRREVESLLAMEGEAAHLMTAPVLDLAAAISGDEPVESMVGRRIGAYEVIEEIGHGGMGEVYLARRADDEYQKRVAIKLIKRGIDTRFALQRFRRERQILAGLDHANVAGLLDGGTTEEGLPYFVMEHVEGLPINVYCDTHKLSIIERLELIRTVCSAVHYAHQNLIVHRDLKPANILITPEGVPKLLDFGIAKILDPDSPMAGETTMIARLMTPDYASPEQVRGQPITTASDIYSMGVLLYELLTGCRPYRITAQRPQEIERAICEQEPERPSAAVTSTTEQAIATSEPVSRVRRRLAGDLDNIVLMALRKEPRRRYSSMGQFAEDIGRYLVQMPVIARNDTLAYRAAKFVHRNRLAVWAAGLVCATLFAGVVIASWEARRANQQKVRAELQETDNRRLLYAAQMGLAFQAWEISNTGRVAELLEFQRPESGREDLRGFEWYYLWELIHPHQLTFQHTSSIGTVEFSTDSKILMAAGEDRIFRRWDLTDGRELPAITRPIGVSYHGFASDHRNLVLTESKQRLIVWDVISNRDVAQIDGFTRQVLAAIISPDGKTLGVATEGGAVELWDLTARRQLRLLQEPLDMPAGMAITVYSLAFSPDGKWLAAGNIAGKVILWDLATGRRRTTLDAHTTVIPSVAVSPDSRILATGSRDTDVKLWDLLTAKQLGELKGHTNSVQAVVFSPDGRILATGGSDSTVKLWNIAQKKELRTFRGHTDTVFHLAFSSDGTKLASGGYDRSIRVWDVASYLQPAALTGHARMVSSVAFSPDGKLIASGSHDQTLKIWDAKSRRELATLRGHTLDVICVAWSPSGEILATGSWDRSVRLWDVAGRRERAVLKGHSDSVSSVAFSPDSKTLATGSLDGSAKLWEVASQREIATLRDDSNRGINAVAISPDGRRLAAGDANHSVTIWDLTTRRPLAKLLGHSGSVDSLQFSPDGRILATGGFDRTVKFWDVTTGREIASFQANANDLHCLTFSPDGKTLATGGADRMVKLWNVATRQELATLKGHTNIVESVAFSPDGRTLASASWDNTIRLWQAASDR